MSFGYNLVVWAVITQTKLVALRYWSKSFAAVVELEYGEKWVGR